MAMRPGYRKNEEERKKLVCGCAPRSHGIHLDEPAGWFLGATAESNRRFGPTTTPRYRRNLLQALHAYRHTCGEEQTEKKKKFTPSIQATTLTGEYRKYRLL